MIGNTQAQMYDNQYRHDSNYYQDDNRYSYDNNHQKKSYGDIQKIKCVNSNINVNGIDITQIPQDHTATATAANEGSDAIGAQNGNGWGDRINFERNLVNICVNVNDNEQVKVTPPEEEPEPPTCKGCFTKNLELEERNELLTEIRELSGGQVTSFDQVCAGAASAVESGEQSNVQSFSNSLEQAFQNAGLSEDQFNTVLDCLNDVFNNAFPPPSPP